MSFFFKLALGGVGTAGAACAVGVPANDWGGWYSGENADNYGGWFNSGAYPCPTFSGYKKIQTYGDRFYPFGSQSGNSLQFFKEENCKTGPGHKASLSSETCSCPEQHSESTNLQIREVDEKTLSPKNDCYCLNEKKE